MVLFPLVCQAEPKGTNVSLQAPEIQGQLLVIPKWRTLPKVCVGGCLGFRGSAGWGGQAEFCASCSFNGSCTELSAWEAASFPSSLYNLRTPEIGIHWKIPLTARPGKCLSKETILWKFQLAGSSSYLVLAVINT